MARILAGHRLGSVRQPVELGGPAVPWGPSQPAAGTETGLRGRRPAEMCAPACGRRDVSVAAGLARWYAQPAVGRRGRRRSRPAHRKLR